MSAQRGFGCGCASSRGESRGKGAVEAAAGTGGAEAGAGAEVDGSDAGKTKVAADEETAGSEAHAREVGEAGGDLGDDDSGEWSERGHASIGWAAECSGIVRHGELSFSEFCGDAREGSCMAALNGVG